MDDDSHHAADAWMWVGKLSPPQLQLNSVERDLLLQRLDRHHHVTLDLIVSPPGFGKTTLLAQWRTQLLHHQQPVAWISLDETDHDHNRFMALVVMALEDAGVELGPLAKLAREMALDRILERTLAGILQGLAKGGRRITLMLDDYHRASSPAVDRFVLTLLERGSAWLRLVVATRQRPTWPLGTMKARGVLHEVHAGDLILSLKEATSVLGDGVDEAEASVVHSRTEGWAVAIQLARLWFAEGSGSSHGLPAFSGQINEVADYLTEQVIANLPDDCQDFLVETSLLERFNASLADAARGRSDSDSLLPRVAALEALLVPLDAERSWFRYHLMLADFLRPRLSAERAREIHRAAACWLADHQDWSSAVAHAIQADDVDLAANLLHRAGGWKLVVNRGIPYTQALLHHFDDLSKRTHPELLMIQAYLHSKLGDRSLALEYLRLGQIIVHSSAPHLAQDLVVIEALVHIYFDQLDYCAQWPASEEATNERLPNDPLGQATVLCVGAVAAIALGRPDDAMTAVRAAHTRMRLVQSRLGENYCLLHESQVLAITGQLAVSRAKTDEALALAEANFGTDSALKALVNPFKAQHLYWEGRWAEVQRVVDEGADTLREVDGWLDVFAISTDVSWRVALRKENLNKALSIIEGAAQLARERSLTRLQRLAHCWRIDLMAQSGLIAQAQNEIRAAALDIELAAVGPTPVGMDWRFLEAATMALSRMHLLCGAAHLARPLLARATSLMKPLGLHLPIWRLRLMEALAERRIDESSFSAQQARTVLEPIFENRLSGLLLEIGPPVLGLLQLLEGNVPPLAGAAAGHIRSWQSPKSQTIFSPKENEVLTLLAEGQSNKMIARALGCSENTVKFHIKNVFTKLGVERRSAAITKALQEGLVHVPTRASSAEG